MDVQAYKNHLGKLEFCLQKSAQITYWQCSFYQVHIREKTKKYEICMHGIGLMFWKLNLWLECKITQPTHKEK